MKGERRLAFLMVLVMLCAPCTLNAVGNIPFKSDGSTKFTLPEPAQYP